MSPANKLSLEQQFQLILYRKKHTLIIKTKRR